MKGTAGACYSLTINGPYQDQGEECDIQSIGVYSNCTSISVGCNIYSVATCTSCTSLSGQYFHDSVDWYDTNGGNPCELQGAGICGRSDIRLKQGIETLTNVMDNLLKIDVKEYDWNDNLDNYQALKSSDKLHSIGIIAQELKLIYPQLVYRRLDGYLSIYYDKLNAVLIEGVKEQQEMIEEIDSEIKYIREKLA